MPLEGSFHSWAHSDGSPFNLDRAWGVFLRLSALIASEKPGTSFSITFNVASGVTSRGLKPVPPVVRKELMGPGVRTLVNGWRLSGTK